VLPTGISNVLTGTPFCSISQLNSDAADVVCTTDRVRRKTKPIIDASFRYFFVPCNIFHEPNMILVRYSLLVKIVLSNSI
jgi:hypothetical protein